MSGMFYKEEVEGEDFLLETGEIGEVGEDEDPLGDLNVLVKQVPELMSANRSNIIGRMDIGGSEEIEGGARKRRNKNYSGGIESIRMKIRREDRGSEISGDDDENPGVSEESSNCIFCQRKTRNQSGDTEGIPRAEFDPCASLLLTFNQIWPYLQNNCQDAENMISFIEMNFANTRPVSIFPSLPTMCVFCGGELEKVDARLKSLWMGIKNLSSAIQKSRTSKLHHSVTEYNTINESEAISEPSRTASPVDEIGRQDDSESDIDDNIDPDYIKSEQEEISSNESDFDDIDYKPIMASSKAHGSSKKSIPKQSPNKNPENPGTSGNNTINETDVFYICAVDNCGQKFLTRKSATRHQQDFHDIGKNFKIRFSCSICEKSFRVIERLKSHKKSAHGTNTSILADFKCDLCRETVPEKEMFAHVRDHIGEEYIIKCTNPKCHLAFAKPASLFLHLKNHKPCSTATPDDAKPKNGIGNCQVCGYATRTLIALRSHITKVHENPTKNYSCPISGCTQKFTVKQSVVMHLPNHDFLHCLSYQNCVLCSEELKTDKMEEHLKDKHQVSEIIKCKQCAFLFSTREQLLEHMFDHRFGDLLCDMCEDGVKYSRHTNLREHYFTEHKIGSRIPCEICGTQFWSSEDLQKHLNNQHKDSNIAPKIFKCEECGAEYKSEPSLYSHNIRVHGAEPLTCSFCPETFCDRPAFNKHIREHKGVISGIGSEFICKVEGCGKNFNSYPALSRHKRVDHLGVRHVCDICGKSFTGAGVLNLHKDSVHFGLRPYVCDQCGESFGSRTVLTRHKLVHTGERPFECEICRQRFRHKEVLQRHLEGHEKKGSDFKPNGPMNKARKRVDRKY